MFLYDQPEIVWERVRSWQEVLEDEQSVANDYLTNISVDGVGTVKTVGTLVKMSDTPGSPKGDPPRLGEANEELLATIGLSAEARREIEAHATSTRESLLAEIAKMKAK